VHHMSHLGTPQLGLAYRRYRGARDVPMNDRNGERRSEVAAVV